MSVNFELESFIQKFKSLSYCGYDSSLTLQSRCGDIHVTLSSNVGSLPPLTNSQYSTPPPQRKRRRPLSYYRRQAIRRANTSPVSNQTVDLTQEETVSAENDDFEPNLIETAATETNMDEAEPLEHSETQNNETYAIVTDPTTSAPSVDTSIGLEFGDGVRDVMDTLTDLTPAHDDHRTSQFQSLFFCTVCSRAFHTRKKLEEHHNEHDYVPEFFPLVCDSCSKEFDPDGYIEHLDSGCSR